VKKGTGAAMQGIRSQDRFILVLESAGPSQWWLFMNHQQNVTASGAY